MCNISSKSKGIPWPNVGTTHYHEQLEFPDKGRAITGLIVSNGKALEPLDLLNGLALSPDLLSKVITRSSHKTCW